MQKDYCQILYPSFLLKKEGTIMCAMTIDIRLEVVVEK